MLDKTTLFDLEEINTSLVQTTLDEVYNSLKEKGYNPISQIVGYLVSGDPGFITNYNNARTKILSIDRSKILEAVVREYLEN